MGVIEFILLITFLMSLYYSIKYYHNNNKNKKEKCNKIYIPQNIEEEEVIEIDNRAQYKKLTIEENIQDQLPNELDIVDKTDQVVAFIADRFTQSFNI